uniref:Uncharacterized protein n=1 Tax=Oryza punctata TaxID=4537 RepID=A0A0E0MF92_ORYPU
MIETKGFLDLGIGRRSKRVDGGEAVRIKTQVLAPQRQLLHDQEVLPLEEVAVKSFNRNGACRRGKPLDFPKHAAPTKMVLIDDNPRYALECAEDGTRGMRVLLSDYHNSYRWCKTGVDESHSLVTKVHNWQEVEENLLSWVVPEI